MNKTLIMIDDKANLISLDLNELIDVDLRDLNTVFIENIVNIIINKKGITVD